MKRYKVNTHGDLVDQETGATIQVKDWRVEKQNMLVFMDGGGTPRRIARRMIDESAYSFGPPYGSPVSQEKKSTLPAVRKQPQMVQVAPPAEQSVTMTKDELIQVHTALQSAADLTLQKLVTLIRG